MEFIFTLGAAVVIMAFAWALKIDDPKDPSELTHDYDGRYSTKPSGLLGINLAETTGLGQHFVESSVLALRDIEFEFTKYCRTKNLAHKELDGYIKFETFAGSALRGKWTLSTESREFKIGSVIACPQDRVYRIAEGGEIRVKLFKIIDVYALSGTFILEDLKQHFYVNCDGKGNYEINKFYVQK